MRLILVRHGQTEWNRLHKTQGHHDSPLTARGVRQAELAGKALAGQAFAGWRINAFFCSDSGRAVQTAERIAAANPGFPRPRLDPRLRELNYGDWEGLLHDEIVKDYPEPYRLYRSDPASFRAPHGESFADLRNRFLGFVADLPRDDGATCLIVSHAGVLRVGVLALLGKTIAEKGLIPSVPEASITTLQNDGGAWTILDGFTTRHLEELERE